MEVGVLRTLPVINVYAELNWSHVSLSLCQKSANIIFPPNSLSVIIDFLISLSHSLNIEVCG